MRRKGDLPQKICAACGRPFAWRKKWERVWEEVRFCSDRCRRQRAKQKPPAARMAGPASISRGHCRT
ncbi:DUF2256 domain-containing protein [uncultured Roseibium sp.]|uniref:DUF2256 domain-containing protein n=1 Tax=uncultured Roseibium sp. TaxID=1936171 RepID=UPI00261C7A01|nr:DUF2256 domain-containing protein [uncultured Roseibium sp.]